METETTRHLLEVVGKLYGDVPARVVAGSLMRVSVAMAIEFAGIIDAPDACRQALETVLSDIEPRSLQ